MSEIIGMAKLQALAIDEETTSFQVRWDNTLLVTAYDHDRTFILTRDGERIVLQRSLTEVLSSFARENLVYHYEMAALYGMVGCQTFGYIAGHNRLVPTCGRTNSQVVFFMVQYLDHAAELASDKRVSLRLKGRHETYHVYVDTSYKTFCRMVRGADEVARLQLQDHECFSQRYGKHRVEELGERRYEDDYCVIEERKRHSKEIRLAEIVGILIAAHTIVYNEEIDPRLLRCIKRLIDYF